MSTAKDLYRTVSTLINESQPIRAAKERYYERQFRHWPGAFRGVYRSFEEARRSAPPGAKLGYNHAELGDMYKDRLDRVFPSDYPALFWLDRILREETTLFDYGGHVGIAYHAYSKYLAYPASLRWTVYDVPEVVEKGISLAHDLGQNGIAFTTELAEAANHAVLLAAGSLQYVETPLSVQLQQLARMPKYLIVNKTPLHDGPGYVTLQNTYLSFNPYAVFNRRSFVDSLLALGYELMDSWHTADSCRVPLYPEHSVECYSGLYLRRRTS